MISLSTAIQLKQAGLPWIPALHDFFALPDRQMDDRVFVLADMLATVDFLQGQKVVSFQGASEWALDSLVMSEAVWMPSEAQLRGALVAALLETGRPEVRLLSGLNGHRCEITYGGEAVQFQAEVAAEAYAAALLHILKVRRESAPPAGQTG